MYFFSVNFNGTAYIRAVAVSENAHGKLRTSCAHKAGYTDNLALSHVQGYIVNDFLIGVNGMIYVPVFNFKRHISDGNVMTLRESVSNLSADHALYDPCFTEIVNALCKRFDGFAVAQNGDIVCNIGDLVKLMGNDYRGKTVLLEL